MIIYKDIMTGDEIVSDTYDLKEIDDAVYEVDCRMITKGDIKVNTGAQEKVQGYGGESAGGDDDDEPQDGPAEDAPAKVNDIIDGFHLCKLPPYEDKQAFKADFLEIEKRLEKKLKEKGDSEEEIKSKFAKMRKYAPKLAKKINDYEPYSGESFETQPDLKLDEMAIPLYLNYREDGVTPYFTIWKHALTEMKV